MSKFALMVFPDEEKANEGVRALEGLQQRCSALVYGTAVIQRDEKGALSIRKRSGVSLGVGVAALLGGLIEEFLACVERELSPGKIGVIAELSDQRVTPVDAVVEPLDGKVVREWGDDFLGRLLEKRTKAREAKLAARTAEPAGTEFERIARHLTGLITGEQEKLERAAEDIRRRFETTREQVRTSIAALEYQAAHARPEVGIRIVQRIAALRQEFLAREQRILAICQELVEREELLRRQCEHAREGDPQHAEAESRLS